jgi:hypothetical protein
MNKFDVGLYILAPQLDVILVKRFLRHGVFELLAGANLHRVGEQLQQRLCRAGVKRLVRGGNGGPEIPACRF